MFDAVTYGAAVGAAKRYTDEHSGSDDAVKYTEQDLTTEQQAQARENIGAAASDDIPTDAVKYSAQTLTDAQKTQARTNIGVVQPDWRQSNSSNADYIKNKPPILAVYPGTSGSFTGGTGMNNMNEATKQNSIAYGYGVSAKGDYSAAFGYFLQALHDYEIAYGKFNQSNADTAFSIGDGTDTQNRHNLMELRTDGTLLLNGNAVKTEGGDDDKPRLGQITANGKYGIANILSTAPSSVTFLTTDSPIDLSGTGYRFGDFYLYHSSGAKIALVAGYTEIISKIGQWIHAENCYCMFYNCNSSSMTSLNVSMLDTSEVKNMGRMFYNCTKLTSLDLSTFDTSNVEDMTAMFDNCGALTSLDLSGFDTSKVQSMSSMFAYCAALKTLDISSFDMSNVTNYDSMLGRNGSVDASGITTLKTPKINPHTNVPLPRTLYSQDGTAYTKLPVTTGTSIELRQSWT